MKIGLIFSKKSVMNKDEIEILFGILSSVNAEAIFCSEYPPFFIKNYSTLKLEDIIKISDIILVFGGDGMIIKVAKKAAFYGKSVLGINSGHLGFLSCLEKKDMGNLKEILKGNFEVSERIMLECIYEKEKFLVLNDVVLSRGTGYKVADYSVFKEGFGEIFRCLSDGVVVATPTGSTAYFLSAGGSIVEPGLDCIGITAVCPHMIGHRSGIFSTDGALKVRYRPKEGSQVCFFVDGEFKFSSYDEGYVEIRKSNLKAKIIQTKNSSFYDKIENKLIKGVGFSNESNG